MTRWGNCAAQVQSYVAANWLHQRSASSVLIDDEQMDAHIPHGRSQFSAGAALMFSGGLGAWGGL